MYRIVPGSNIEALKQMIEDGVQVDAIVTDPPYALKFMGKKWDIEVPSVEFWQLAYQVLKPGGHVLSFGGTRTYHRMVVNIEDAGFEIRDQVLWLYGSGFPKSLDVSKAIDKAADYRLQSEFRRTAVKVVLDAGMNLPLRSLDDWTREDHAPGQKWWNLFCDWLPTLNDAQRESIKRQIIATGKSGKNAIMGGLLGLFDRGVYDVTTPATPAAVEWSGWGTALKPAVEPICLARKPLSEATVAGNVLKWGTGAINVDGCRIGPNLARPLRLRADPWRPENVDFQSGSKAVGNTTEGRWPANVILDEEAGAMLDEQSLANGIHGAGISREKNVQSDYDASSYDMSGTRQMNRFGDSGGASRFFYCAKASKKERRGSKHPTIKPVALMRYLCRLITPVGGMILDPFAGSGTTGEAAEAEGFDSILIERESEHLIDIERRMQDCVHAVGTSALPGIKTAANLGWMFC